MTILKVTMMSLTMASALVASPAKADVTSKEVHYDDLDLSASAGRERLQLRIRQAVKLVCGPPPSLSIKDRQDRLACEQQANLQAAPETERIIAVYMKERRRALGDTAIVASK